MEAREVRIKILQRMGWKVVDLNDNPMGAKVKGPNWALVNPNGATEHWSFRAADAWDNAPRLESDIDAAMKLIPPTHHFELKRALKSDEWMCCITSQPNHDDWRVGRANHPAHAICLACYPDLMSREGER